MNLNYVKTPNPMFHLIEYLNQYHEEKLINTKLQFLIKNLKTHFYKLIYTVNYIHKIQKDSEFISDYNETGVVISQPIEYCFYKISTIVDIAHEIADSLLKISKSLREYNDTCEQNNKPKLDKKSYLEELFTEYNNEKNKDISLDWYLHINKIRNKIVHGGINIMPFYDKDKSTICFQAYDKNLDEILPVHYYYSNRCSNYIAYADNFFGLYTNILFNYLTDFFEFIITKLETPETHYVEEVIEDSSELTQLLEMPYKYWAIDSEEFDIFKQIVKQIILLEKSEGYSMSQFSINDSDLKRLCKHLQFKLISEANF